MSAADLTRWNRAGLARFRYVDGNAATYLDTLRQALRLRFPDWQDLELDVPAGAEHDAVRLERLLDQYFEREPRSPGGRARDAVTRLRVDPAWQIARAAARAVHVAGEYLDAYANEGFLRTATQWNNVRWLVEMLDVHPAPAASASTLLALVAKGERGRVEAGFQVQHKPPAGGPPIVFETLADVEVDPVLNAVRLAGWNRSQAAVGKAADAQHSPWIAGEGSEIAAGQLAVLVREAAPEQAAPEQAAAVAIAAVDAASRRVLLAPVGPANPIFIPIAEPTGTTLATQRIFREVPPQPPWPPWSVWPKGTTRLLARPSFVERPRLNGVGVVHLAGGHDLAVGEVVAWQAGAWTLATVLAVGERAVRVDGAALPPPDVELFRTLRVERKDGNLFLPLTWRVAAKPAAGGFALLDPAADFADEKGDDGTVRLRKVKDAQTTEARFVHAAARAVGRSAAAPAGVLLFDGKPGKLAAGQWAIADDGQSERRGLRALRIDRIDQQEDHYAVTFAGAAGSVVRLHALFAETLHPEGYDRSVAPLAGTRLPLDLASLGGALPPLLARGLELVLERTDGDEPSRARKVRVEAVDAAAPSIAVLPAIAASEGFTLGNAVLRGNLAMAGHGEGKPEKVLGTGDATRANQSFVLAQQGISFVADPTQPNGVRADVAVTVEGQTWEQVASLRESGPTDPHYTARVTEEGHLEVAFGDGRAGRRLPTGSNKVRIRFRVGSGLAGNVPRGSFAKPKLPHRLVAGVRQPFAATGGNDQEPVESLRQHAPASVLTLERAVSLEDFAHLAARQASVWQARAFPLPTAGRRQGSIEVVVVPAGGGELGGLAATLRELLVAHTLPGVDVLVSGYESKPCDLAVTAYALGRQYDFEDLRVRVRAALLAAFGLQRRRLGQDLFLSEVVQVVEAVRGVESSASVLAGDPSLRRLAASGREVVHLAPATSLLDVRVQELEL